jgi:formamidopyrimidine-DNA glycosylase
LLLERATKLKLILTDPTAVTGIGPVYSDEILHGAGLRHDRESHELSSQEMRRLYRALVETLHEAAKRRGSTLADGLYSDLSGKPGDYQVELKVYERDGQACKRCRGVVAKAKLSGKVVYYCPECQV